jgi:hypothetical protein
MQRSDHRAVPAVFTGGVHFQRSSTPANYFERAGGRHALARTTGSDLSGRAPGDV